MNFSLATLVPNDHQLLDDEIARAEAELEAVSNKLQRLIQLRQLSQNTEAAKETLGKLASEADAQKHCHDEIFASIEVLKGRLAEET
jgi:hypothetical protein